MSHSSDLSDWSDPSDSFTMPFTTNLLELEHPLAAPAFFLRLQRDAPPAPESPDLLIAPLEGTWTAPVPPQPESPVGTAVRRVVP